MSRKKNKPKTIKKYVLFQKEEDGRVEKSIRPYDYRDIPYTFVSSDENCYLSLNIYNSLEDAIIVAGAIDGNKDIKFAKLNKVEETLANIYIRRYFN